MYRFLTLAAWITAGVLLIFTVRRWLFTLLALWPVKPDSRPPISDTPSVLLLAPIRNEAPTLPQFLPALAALAYPKEKLTIILVNDGSTDGSRELLEHWVQGRPNWHVLSLRHNVGKAQALNEALAHFPQGEIIAIYDADERPRPDTLAALVVPFADEHVGGVSGRRAVSNALASPAASYTTFEGLVHQLVTMRAKDRLKLAPAILGANCAYRRTALAEVGNFQPGALLEDSDLTLKLSRAGWQIRFEPEAVSFHQVPQSLSGYWRQHTRWARGFNEVAKSQATATLQDKSLPWPLRLELAIFALGYLDRLALLVGAGLALVSLPGIYPNVGTDLASARVGDRIPPKGRRARTQSGGSPLHPALSGSKALVNSSVRRWLGRVIALSLLTPLLQIVAALLLGRASPGLWRRLMWLPFFFAIDLAMAVAGMVATLRQSPQIWEERRARR